MIFKLQIEKDATRLNLVSGNRTVDTLKWQENNNLSRVLLERIDRTLKKNEVSLDKICGYKIMGKVPKNYTSYRIAKITFESLMWARST